MPEIAEILRNTIKTTSTLEDREEQLKAFFEDLSRFSDDTRVFLDENEDNIIRLGQLGAQQLRLLAKYAPEYPCLAGGLVNLSDRQTQVWRGFTLHIVLETLPNQPRGYNVSDVPRLGEDRGPSCLHLPSPGWTQENPLRHQPDFDDGVDNPTGKGTSRVAPGLGRGHSGGGSGYAGTRDEAAVLKSLLGPGLGVPADQVPDLGVLLVGPMARGAEVTLR
jgi:phospholipid/cholesterol/gamma-HCH transport system substrate-binding protein